MTGRISVRAACAPLFALALFAAPAVAQMSGPAQAMAPAAAIDALYAGGEVEAAYESAIGALEREPEAYDLLWRAARASTALGVLHRDDEDARERWLEEGIALAARAREADPAGPEARYWSFYARGERALRTGPRHAARLANELFTEATEVLAGDPDDAFAHQLLGTIHMEVMTLSGFERFLGRTFLGGEAMKKATWEGAETHLTRAAELDRTSVRGLTALGRLHARRGRGEEAKTALRAALALPMAEPFDRVLQEEARVRLEAVLEWAPDGPGGER